MSASGPRLPGNSHPERRVTFVAVVLAAVAVALLVALPNGDEAVVPAPMWLLPVLTLGFVIAELSVFRFIFRRESFAFSLSEIPLALSFVYLAPGPAMAARVLGAITVVVLIRRPPPYKVVFNTGMFMFEVAVAVVVFRGIIDMWGADDNHFVVAAIARHGRRAASCPRSSSPLRSHSSKASSRPHRERTSCCLVALPRQLHACRHGAGVGADLALARAGRARPGGTALVRHQGLRRHLISVCATSMPSTDSRVRSVSRSIRTRSCGPPSSRRPRCCGPTARP